MRIIFLDIDGVIQPGCSEVRFTAFDVEKILSQTSLGLKQDFWLDNEKKRLYNDAIKKPTSMDLLKMRLTQFNHGYAALDKYDIAAVCCDWDRQSVDLLRRLCCEVEAKLVISSDWRYGKTLEQLKLLFEIHGLADFVIDTISALGEDRIDKRAEQIKKYVIAHPDITRFVIFDDLFKEDYDKMLPGQLIYHPYKQCFNTDLYNQAKKILLGH